MTRFASPPLRRKAKQTVDRQFVCRMARPSERGFLSVPTPDCLGLGSNPILGWCGWTEFTHTRIRRYYDPWVGLRHTRCSCYTLARTPSTLSTPKYYRIPTVPPHRTNRIPSPLPNRVVNRLVDKACLGRCAEIGRPLRVCQLDQRCFPLAGGFNPLPTRPPTLVGCLTEGSHI